MSFEIRRVALVYNPNAGSLHGNLNLIRRLEAELQARGLSVDSHATTCGGDATRLARETVAAGYDALIVCGGDGTINEAVQAMVGAQTALVVYPCGTANVFAGDLKLTCDPKKVSQLVAAGQTQIISLGRAFTTDPDWHRYFLLMAGIGLDAAMVRNVNLNLKRRIGEGAYFFSAMDYLMRWPLAPFSLIVDGQEYEATYATISNSPSYGGGFLIAPGARMDDDQLNVCVFNSRSRFDYIGYAALARSGRHTRCANVKYLEAQTIAAKSAREVFVQLDGELVGQLPMRFEIVPHALRVIAAD